MQESELIKFIAKKIQYDGSLQSCRICKKCGHKEEEYDCWIYHKDTLASEIANVYQVNGKISSIIRERILYILTDIDIIGDPKEDAKNIAEFIIKELGMPEPLTIEKSNKKKPKIANRE